MDFYFCIEIIAKRIDLDEPLSEFLEILAFNEQKKSLAFFVEVAANIIVRGLDPALNSRQHRVVRLSRGVFDDRVDERSRLGRLLPDFKALGFKDFLSLRIGGIIGGRLHFRDDHLAKRQRLLQRTNVHACQMTVGLNVLG